MANLINTIKSSILLSSLACRSSTYFRDLRDSENKKNTVTSDSTMPKQINLNTS